MSGAIIKPRIWKVGVWGWFAYSRYPFTCTSKGWCDSIEGAYNSWLEKYLWLSSIEVLNEDGTKTSYEELVKSIN